MSWRVLALVVFSGSYAHGSDTSFVTTTPIAKSHPNINLLRLDTASAYILNHRQQIPPDPTDTATTSSFNWWPYPAWGVTSTSAPPSTTTPVATAGGAVMLDPAQALTFASLSPPSPSPSPSSDLSSSSPSPPPSSKSLILLTALPPSSSSPPPNSPQTPASPYTHPTHINPATYLVPLFAVAGIVAGGVVAWVGLRWVKSRRRGDGDVGGDVKDRRRRRRRNRREEEKEGMRSRNENGFRPRKSGGTLLEAGTRYEDIPVNEDDSDPPTNNELGEDRVGSYSWPVSPSPSRAAAGVDAPLLSVPPSAHMFGSPSPSPTSTSSRPDTSTRRPERSNTISTAHFSISTVGGDRDRDRDGGRGGGGAHGKGAYDSLRQKSFRRGLLDRIQHDDNGDGDVRRRVSRGKREGSVDGRLLFPAANEGRPSGSAEEGDEDDVSVYTTMTGATRLLRTGSANTAVTTGGFRIVQEDPEEDEHEQNWGWGGLDPRFPPPLSRALEEHEHEQTISSSSLRSQPHSRSSRSQSTSERHSPRGPDPDSQPNDHYGDGEEQSNSSSSLVILKEGKWAPASSGWWGTIRSHFIKDKDTWGDADVERDRFTQLPVPGSRSRSRSNDSSSPQKGGPPTTPGRDADDGSPTPRLDRGYFDLQNRFEDKTLPSPPPPPPPRPTTTNPSPPPKVKTGIPRSSNTLRQILPRSPPQITSPKLESQILFTPTPSVGSCLDLVGAAGGGETSGLLGGTGGGPGVSGPSGAVRGPQANKIKVKRNVLRSPRPRYEPLPYPG